MRTELPSLLLLVMLEEDAGTTPLLTVCGCSQSFGSSVNAEEGDRIDDAKPEVAAAQIGELSKDFMDGCDDADGNFDGIQDDDFMLPEATLLLLVLLLPPPRLGSWASSPETVQAEAQRRSGADAEDASVCCQLSRLAAEGLPAGISCRQFIFML